jgi:hypothetical protein
MLEWILLGMAYDVVNTRNKEAKKKEIEQKKRDLRWRLQRSVTQNHSRGCICRLCTNRRQSIKDQLEDLK